jgi:hypothetical protein
MRRLFLLATLILAGCVSMAKVGPGDVVVRERMVVRLDSAWNRFDGGSSEKIELWTTDGLPIDVLRFIVGVQDGEELAKIEGRKDKQLPRFRKTMQPHEIVETVEAYLTANGSTLTRDKLAPAQFGGGEGFRFEYTLLAAGSEVQMKGVGWGVVVGERLYLMLFQAPRIYYFGKNLPRVEAVAQSVVVRG